MKLEPNIADDLTAEAKRIAAAAGMTLPDLMREIVNGEISEENFWRQQLAETGKITA